MSLAPEERRTLARIEDSLSRSDPRLASWLTTFTLPARLRLMVGCKRAIIRGRRLAWRRWPARLALLAAGAAVLSLIAAGMIALGRVKLPACAGPGVHTSAFRPVLTCRRASGSVAGRLDLPGNLSRPGASMTARGAGPGGPALARFRTSSAGGGAGMPSSRPAAPSPGDARGHGLPVRTAGRS